MASAAGGLSLEPARIGRGGALQLGARCRRLVLAGSAGVALRLREQRIRDRRVETDRSRKERLAAHTHDILERSVERFVPARQETEAVTPGRDAHGRQMKADHAGIRNSQLVLQVAARRRDHQHVRDAAAIELIAGGDRDVIELAALYAGGAQRLRARIVDHLLQPFGQNLFGGRMGGVSDDVNIHAFFSASRLNDCFSTAR